jgi:hypothetical protein
LPLLGRLSVSLRPADQILARGGSVHRERVSDGVVGVGAGVEGLAVTRLGADSGQAPGGVVCSRVENARWVQSGDEVPVRVVRVARGLALDSGGDHVAGGVVGVARYPAAWVGAGEHVPVQVVAVSEVAARGRSANQAIQRVVRVRRRSCPVRHRDAVSGPVVGVGDGRSAVRVDLPQKPVHGVVAARDRAAARGQAVECFVLRRVPPRPSSSP